jgi:lipoprotein-anchoring transpeptidase ErfK/SrfK
MKSNSTLRFLVTLASVLLPLLGNSTVEDNSEPLSHQVQPKETLYAISKSYRCTIADLKAVNHLTSDVIRIGQVLRIPEGLTKVDEPKLAAPAVPSTKDKLRTLSESDRWKLHIYLDRAQFAPGKVDGLTGEFTIKAAERWVRAVPGRSLETLIATARAEVGLTHVFHKIPAVAARYVGAVPSDLPGKAAAKNLPYESLSEFVAERYHTDLSTLRRLNPGSDLPALKIGDMVKVPAVKPFAIETFPSANFSKSGQSGMKVSISHQQRMIEVMKDDGTLIAAFPITVGTKPEHVRTGSWKVRALVANPTFLWDDSMLKEGKKGIKQHLLPPGPNNPVGILWMEIEPNKGPVAHIGIHGTNDPARIGRNHSSGCIRLANWDIVRLAQMVGRGTVITWGVPLTSAASVLAAH